MPLHQPAASPSQGLDGVGVKSHDDGGQDADPVTADHAQGLVDLGDVLPLVGEVKGFLGNGLHAEEDGDDPDALHEAEELGVLAEGASVAAEGKDGDGDSRGCECKVSEHVCDDIFCSHRVHFITTLFTWC